MSEMSIKLRHLSISRSEWEVIFHRTIHDYTVVARTIFSDDSWDAMKKGMDLCIEILRLGIKIEFQDGENSTKHIRKVSPPLWVKFYEPLKQGNKP